MSYKPLKKTSAAASLLGSLLLFPINALAENNTTFVHLFEWKWNDIAQECEEVLGPKGIAAVQVSPPNKVIEGSQWWTRYQPVSYSFEGRSGSREEFQSMVERCAAVDVEIYVDAVINHMAAWGRNFPEVPYYSDDFHNCAANITNYGDRDNVQNCDLVGLNDLNTGKDSVQEKIAAYMNDALSMGATGFRVDAAKHIAANDLGGIVSRLNNNPFVFFEVIDLGGEPVKATEYTGMGSVTEFKYSAWIGDAFRNGSLSGLSSFGSGMLDSGSAIVFTDNHDNQRGHGAGGSSILTFKNGDLYKLANIYMLAWPYGYPKLMSSYDFNDTDQGPPSSPVYNGSSANCGNGEWVCEHRWPEIINMVAFRNATNGEAVTNWWDNGSNQIAFGRGDKGFVVINRDENNSLQQELATGLPAGEYCDVISGDECSVTVSVDGSGNASFSVAPMSAVAIYTGGGQSDNPVAKIIGAPEHVDLGESVTLDGSSSSDPNGSIKSYSWSTGETTPSITATLDKEGENSFTLTVTDDEGNTGSSTVSIWAGDLPPQGEFAALNFRGTANGWKTTAMKLVADNIWQVEVEFDGAEEQRFKFDESTTWAAAWGDGDGDGVLDQTEKNDIYTDVSGLYIVEVNDLTKTYKLTKAGSVDAKPTAHISASSTTVKEGEEVTLSAAKSSDAEGSVSYLWDNGKTSEEISLSYDKAGTYEVELTVSDSSEQTDTTSISITVEAKVDEDEKPVARISSESKTILAGETLELSASTSSDDKGITAYLWSTGEKTESIEVNFVEPGDYTLELEVEDEAGQTDTASITITVKPNGLDDKPQARISADTQDVEVGDSISLSASDSTDDKGIVSYLWSTGEKTENISVDFDEAGSFTFELEVEDEAGQTDTASITIVVSSKDDAKPTARISADSKQIEVNESLSLSAVNSSDDNEIVSYEWSTGESSEEIEVSYDEAGTYTLSLTVKDSAGQTDSTEIEIKVSAEEDEDEDNSSESSSSSGSLSWLSLGFLVFMLRARRKR